MTIDINRLKQPFQFSDTPSCPEVVGAYKTLYEIQRKHNRKIFKKEYFGLLGDRRREVVKGHRKCCKNFLGQVSSETEKARQFYEKIAEVWERETGGVVEEEKESFGYKLAHFHRSNKVVLQAVEESLSGQISSLHNNKAMVQTSPTSREIKNVGFFSIETTISSLDKENPLIRLAYEALIHVVQEMPFSSNYWRKHVQRVSSWSTEKINLLSGRIEELREMSHIENSKREHPCELTASLARAHAHKASLIGNCDELASAVFAYLLKEKRIDIKIEIFSIGNGDHAFIVLGRKEGSDPRDYTTWGSDAIVCDPWTRQIYPAALIPKLLSDYKGSDDDANPELSKFNPSFQFLHRRCSNIFSAKEFQKESLIKLPEIESLLVEFHAASQGEEQLSKADELANKILQYPLLSFAEKRNSALSELFSQICYWLPKDWKPAQDMKHDLFPLLHALEAAKTEGIEPLRLAVESGATLKPYDLYNITGKKQEWLFFSDALDIALQTKQPEILTLAIRAGAKPGPGIFKQLFRAAAESEDLEMDLTILRMSVEAKDEVIADDSVFTEAVSRFRCTHRLEFLSLALEAGAEPSETEEKKAQIKESIKQGEISKLFPLLFPSLCGEKSSQSTRFAHLGSPRIRTAFSSSGV